MTADHLIVTGGTGYLGERLIRAALAEGRQVTLLGRRSGPSGVRHVPWHLGEPLPPAVRVTARTALIHLAHAWEDCGELNLQGSELLFASAREAGVATRIFISSQSARQEALNRYGRMKWAIEQRLVGATSLRVGLVYGGKPQAMYGLLCRLARLPVIPMVEPGRTVQPIHVDEVVRGMLGAADGRAGGVLALAGPDQIAFGDALRLIGSAFAGRQPMLLPIPLRPALLACDLSAHLPLLPTIDRERVLGLAGTEPIDSAADLLRLGVEVAPMADRLAAEVRGRRALLAEARAFLRYMGLEPSSALLRRYARAVAGGAIARPHWGLRWREPLGSRSLLAARLRVAARIAEASAAGETTLSGGSRPGRMARLVIGGVVEALALPSRMLAGAVARP